MPHARNTAIIKSILTFHGLNPDTYHDDTDNNIEESSSEENEDEVEELNNKPPSEDEEACDDIAVNTSRHDSNDSIEDMNDDDLHSGNYVLPAPRPGLSRQNSDLRLSDDSDNDSLPTPPRVPLYQHPEITPLQVPSKPPGHRHGRSDSQHQCTLN